MLAFPEAKKHANKEKKLKKTLYTYSLTLYYSNYALTVDLEIILAILFIHQNDDSYIEYFAMIYKDAYNNQIFTCHSKIQAKPSNSIYHG